MVKSERIADAATAGAVTLFGLTLTDLNEIMQITAGFFAAVSAVVAIWFYLQRTKHDRERMQRERDDHDAKLNADRHDQDG